MRLARTLLCLLVALGAAIGWVTVFLAEWHDADWLVRSLIAIALLIVAALTIFLGAVVPYFIWRHK